MERNILITGGLGFIGSHIANALAGKRNCEITVLDICTSSKTEDQGIKVMRGDIFDLDALKGIIQKREISIIIHMVGLASIPDCKENPDKSFQLNVSSVHNVLEAMRFCDVDRLVFPSTAAVYGAMNGPKVNEKVVPEPTNIYGCHKLAAEILINGSATNYGFNPTILRLFNVYGDLNKEQGVVSSFIRKAVAGESLVLRGGDQLRDFVSLSDVVEAFIRSLKTVNAHRRTINVGSGVGVSIREIARMAKKSFPNVEILHKPEHKGEYSIYADVSRMRNLLGCVATNPREGIPNYIEACKHGKHSVACLSP